MNQTQKRLEIIRLAISITDEACISQQLYSLSHAKSDPQLQEIIALLESKNYAQAQRLIVKYNGKEEAESNLFDFANDTDKRETEKEALLQESSDTQDTDVNKEEITDLHDYVEVDHKIADYESADENEISNFLSLDPDEVMASAPQIDLGAPKEKNEEIEHLFDDLPDPKEVLHNSPKVPDPFFEEEATTENEHTTTEEVSRPKEETQTPAQEPSHGYTAMPHIEEKWFLLCKRHGLSKICLRHKGDFSELIAKIRNEGYNKDDIDKALQRCENLRENDEEKAAVLLLLLGATADSDARFMMARALFKGDLLREKKEEAIELIEALALQENHPEALCDLAQIYEHGIILSKDLLKAKQLYKEALEAGSKRADRHLARLESKKGLLGKLFA